MENKKTYTLNLSEIDKTMIALAGGKGVGLGELNQIRGIVVPEGFCITTLAFREAIGENIDFQLLLRDLSKVKSDDRAGISKTATRLREIIEEADMTTPVRDAIRRRLHDHDKCTPFAVRSSATTEDLPDASFAGQHDTFLNIIGEESVMQHVRKCWASLFSERAIAYRVQNQIDHDKVRGAVVIQRMVIPQTSGIMFTADPVNGNRRVVSIDAGFGLGEGLVSGILSADNYRVRDGAIINRRLATKTHAVYALPGGGTGVHEIITEGRSVQALDDPQILQLARLGRVIESHFGCPQDIEWCFADDTFYIVQSRPITTLFPVPEAKDENNHVYISVGHQQMMTDAMKPLGLSLWQLRAARPMFEAGGRLFVDVADSLATPAGRDNLLRAMEQHDPLIKEALLTIIERDDFIGSLPDDGKAPSLAGARKDQSATDIQSKVGNSVEIVKQLIKDHERSLEALKSDIQTKSGPELFDFIVEDIRQSKQLIFHPEHMGVIVAAMSASSWINEKMLEWLGEKSPADILTQSVANNITSEMGLELLNIADVIRPHHEIVGYLQQVKSAGFLDELIEFYGGEEVRSAIVAFLDKYGMRCTGEIDITRTRWNENPAILVPIILSNIKNFGHGAAKFKFAQGLQEAFNKEETLLKRLRELPDGDQKAKDTKAMINLLRNFAGYREYPKYVIVSRFFVYKLSLLNEAQKLVDADIVSCVEDVYYLTFEEFKEAVKSGTVNSLLINTRRELFRYYEKLKPPRVITSEGEVVMGKYKHENLPATAIPGLAVSSGVIEGRARVVLDIENAYLEEGDILVTSFTDPSWTPLFVSIKGLVTEVGGLMTHGAVIAREYGLPAVVGVDNATRLIKDGDRILLNGTEGYVLVLNANF